FHHVEQAYFAEVKKFSKNPEEHFWTKTPKEFGKAVFPSFSVAFGTDQLAEAKLEMFFAVASILEVQTAFPIIMAPLWLLGEYYFNRANEREYKKKELKK
ncbi:MAG: hypothetical protein Q7K43_06310, partial [Candidatus Woesearchaeota archaeon]|nr:hypothetical protein [Candidatus Woesearchaeota archaeon]